MSDLITVVTLSYKKFEYIYETIDSVLNQDYDNIEYIISDDGSEHFPYNEIFNYVEQRKNKNIKNFIILHDNKNYGTVKNINKAYRKASGKYIIPLSADDKFYSNKSVSQIANAFKTRNCNLLVTSRLKITLNGKKIEYIPSEKQKKYIKKLDTKEKQNIAFRTQSYYGMASGCVLSLKKSFIDEWGYFDERYFLWEDGPFLTKYTKFSMLDTDYDIISILYRDGGVSSSPGNELMDKDIELFNSTDRMEYLDVLSRINRRHIEYINKRFITKSFFSISLLYLVYIDVVVKKIIYKFQNRG